MVNIVLANKTIVSRGTLRTVLGGRLLHGVVRDGVVVVVCLVA